MWRGFFVSCRYSVNCWSVSLRPNQVFHQNRNGIRQISQAVRKKRSFWARDMPGLGVWASPAGGAAIGLADILVENVNRRTTLRHRRRGRALVLDNARRRTAPEAVSVVCFRLRSIRLLREGRLVRGCTFGRGWIV